MTRLFQISLIMLTTLFVLEANYVSAQNLDGVVSKLNRLERDIQALNRQVYKGGTPPPSAASAPGGKPEPVGGNAYIIRLEDRLTQLEAQLQNTTNTIEGMNRTVDDVKIRLDKLVKDIDFRLSRLEGGAQAQPSSPGFVQGTAPQPVPAGPPTVSSVPRAAGVQQIGPSTGGPIVSSRPQATGTLGQISETDLSAVQREAQRVANSGEKAAAPTVNAAPQTASVQSSILPKGTPTAQYQHAFSILRKTNYDEAELAFKEFIKLHPDDKLTPNAQYWLGETFYVRANFRDAAEAFLRGYQQAPNGIKAPDTLLKLGMSLASLKKKDDACATFGKLAQDYPNASANIKKHLARERGRAGC